MRYLFFQYKKRIVFLFISFTLCAGLDAQVPFQIGLEAGRGTTFRHRPAQMPFAISQTPAFYAVNAMWETGGQHYWQRAHRQPRLGFTMLAQRYGNDTILGWSYGIMPQIDFWIYRSQRLAVFLRGGFGLTWVHKPYRRGTNELNTAIGSNFNNLTSLALQAEYRLGAIRLGLIGRGLHTSNGRFTTPNLRLNMVGWGLTASYSPGAASKAVLPKEKLPYNKAWKPGIRIGLGAHQVSGPGGARFPVQVLSAFVIKPLSPKFRLWLQGEVSHQSGARPYGFGNPPRSDLAPFEWAWRYSAGAAGELLMGQVGFTLQYMIYLDPPFSNPEYFAFKLGPTLYLIPPDKVGNRPNFFVGSFLKAHQAVAQDIELAAGVVF
jgi:hypothetical protein